MVEKIRERLAKQRKLINAEDEKELPAILRSIEEKKEEGFL